MCKIRVPVFAPNGEPLMPTTAARARKWMECGKAKPNWTKLGIFAVQLVEEPSGREKQDIVLGIDPGSSFTGMAVVSGKEVLCGFNVEMPTQTPKGMQKRSELRRTRRSRKRRRKEKKRKSGTRAEKKRRRNSH